MIMKSLWTCRNCTRARLKRCYSTPREPQTYATTIKALNSLQSNFAAIQALQASQPGWNKLSIPEMLGWVKRIGYEPADFDQLNPIHIAGTKGKGSTATFISSILAQYLPTERSIHAERLPSGVGLYTSPHLRYVRERIQINNQPVSEELFVRYFWEVWDRLEATRPSADQSGPRSIQGMPIYFHFLTLMALHCFLRQQVGTAVIECGIGGEYDTTNILVNPSVTGITSLGIDHKSMLGDTIESIAWHKAGIFKPGVPAYSAPQPEGAARVIRERAKERNTEVQFVPIHRALRSDDIHLGLQGAFQKVNASLAIAISAHHLQRLGFSNIPDPLDSDIELPFEFVAGLESARLEGRCQTFQDWRLDKLTWYFDGAHTLESIEVAAEWFSTTTLPNEAATRILILNQQTQERDANGLARRLFTTLASALNNQRPFAHVIFSVNRTLKTEGYSPDLISMNTNDKDVKDLRVQMELAATWNAIDPEAGVHIVESIEEAVGRARKIGGTAEDAVEVLVTGSLHLVGGLMEVLERDRQRIMGQLEKRIPSL